MKAQTCPIWGTDAEYSETSGDFSEINSARAGGRFEISGSALAQIQNWGEERNPERAALSQAILEANILGSHLRIGSNDLEYGASLIRPRKYKENLMLLLRSAAYVAPEMGQYFYQSALQPKINMNFCVAIAWEQPTLTNVFVSRLLTYFQRGEEVGFFDANNGAYKVSFAGYEIVEELGVSSKQTETVFVAMWFGSDETNAYFEYAVKPAIEAAGYRCVRIDQEHYNERIDEQILAEIRNARAVFVDITCGLAKPDGWSASDSVGAPRGGVYFEAGFAAGLDKPIIWSVQQSIAEVENVVHFDVRQYNQIRWGDDHSENKEFLQARVEATLGRGPNW